MKEGDSPMELFLQQEKSEFSKVKRPNPSKTLEAEVPLPKLEDLETCDRVKCPFELHVPLFGGDFRSS